MRKTESLNSSSEGKIRLKEIKQKKIRKTNSLAENPKYYHPPCSCYNLTVCCDHHTPNNGFLYFLSFMRCPWKELRDLLFPPVPLGGDLGMEKPGWDPQAVGHSSAQPKGIGNAVPPRFAIKHLRGSDCRFVSPGLLSPAVCCLSHRAWVTWFSFLT